MTLPVRGRSPAQAFWGSALLIPEHISFSMLCGALLRWGISQYTLSKRGLWYPAEPPSPAGNGTAVDTALHCDHPAAVFGVRGVQGYTLFPSMGMLTVDAFVLYAAAIWASRLCTRRRAAAPGGDAEGAGAGGAMAPLAEGLLPGEQRTLGADELQAEAITGAMWGPGVLLSVLLATILVPLAFPLLNLSVLQVLVGCAMSALFAVMVINVYGATDQGLPDFPGKVPRAPHPRDHHDDHARAGAQGGGRGGAGGRRWGGASSRCG